MLTKVAVPALIALFFTGCVSRPPFIPTSLDPMARGITIANSTPYNCTILGEIDGNQARLRDREQPTLQSLRLGAMNDLKNNAIHAVKPDRRIMLRIVNEYALCNLSNGNLTPCESEHTSPASYTIRAQIFDCGQK